MPVSSFFLFFLYFFSPLALSATVKQQLMAGLGKFPIRPADGADVFLGGVVVECSCLLSLRFQPVIP